MIVGNLWFGWLLLLCDCAYFRFRCFRVFGCVYSLCGVGCLLVVLGIMMVRFYVCVGFMLWRV